MNIELALISKIVRTRNYREARRSGLTEELFQTIEGRSMWRVIEQYYTSAAHPGRVPSPSWMLNKFPTFERKTKYRESIPELVEQLRQRMVATNIVDGFEDMLGLLDSDPYAALERLRRLNLETQRHVTGRGSELLSDTAGEVFKEYELRKSGNILGVPWPWEEFNKESQGFSEGDLVYIYARPKSLKTWLAVETAFNAYQNANMRILFYSCEMPIRLIRQRVVARFAEVDYDRLRKGKLSTAERLRLKKCHRRLVREEKEQSRSGKQRAFLFSSPSRDPAGGGIGHIGVEAELFQPDLVVVDSSYVLADLRWQEQSKLAMNLKRLAERLKVPLLCTTQRNKEEGKNGIRDMSFGDGGVQAADLLLRIIKGVTIPGRGVDLLAVISGAREFQASGFWLRALPAIGIKWCGWMQEGDDVAMGAKGGGADEGQGTTKKGSKEPPPTSATAVDEEFKSQVNVNIDDVLLH